MRHAIHIDKNDLTDKLTTKRKGALVTIEEILSLTVLRKHIRIVVRNLNT